MKLQSTQRIPVINNCRLSLVLCAGLALLGSSRLKAQVDRPPGLLRTWWMSARTSTNTATPTSWPTSLPASIPATGAGSITWARNQLLPADRVQQHGKRAAAFRRRHLPGGRIRRQSGAAVFHPVRLAAHGAHPHPDRAAGASPEAPSPMLVGEPPRDTSWKLARDRRRLPLHQRGGLGHHPGKPLAHRISRCAGPPAHAGPTTQPTIAAQLDPVLPFSFIRRTSRLLAQRGRGVLAGAGREAVRLRRIASPGWTSAARKSCCGPTTPTAWRPAACTSPFRSS